MVQGGEVYQGSRLLQPLCEVIGRPIDQINFLACTFLAFVCGVLMRKTLLPGNGNTARRHVTEVSLGLTLAYFCFGYQCIHLLLYATIPYLLMLYGPRNTYHTLVLIVAMTYLSIVHAYRMYYDYGGVVMDVTGPMMVMTQKVTSVAFALHDGTSVPDENLSEDQKKQCIRQTPSPLAYFSYLLSFHNIMVGPLVFYSDYIRFIEGTDMMVVQPQQTNSPRETHHQPCPNRAIVETAVIALGCGVVMTLAPIYFPLINFITGDIMTGATCGAGDAHSSGTPDLAFGFCEDDAFLYKTSFVYRNLYIVVATNLDRYKYYFAWKLGELTNLAAGLGFHGYDEENRERWDLLTNMNIWKFETSTSIKVALDSWNLQTLVWLRRIIYDRTPPSVNTLAVFVFSAIWHGFYPGYYVTCVSLAIAVMAARLIRKNIRPYFLESKQKMLFYDLLTFAVTKISGTYCMFPFLLLDFTTVMKVLWSVGFHFHIICLGIIIYYTCIKPAKKRV